MSRESLCHRQHPGRATSHERPRGTVHWTAAEPSSDPSRETTLAARSIEEAGDEDSVRTCACKVLRTALGWAPEAGQGHAQRGDPRGSTTQGEDRDASADRSGVAGVPLAHRGWPAVCALHHDGRARTSSRRGSGAQMAGHRLRGRHRDDPAHAQARHPGVGRAEDRAEQAAAGSSSNSASRLDRDGRTGTSYSRRRVAPRSTLATSRRGSRLRLQMRVYPTSGSTTCVTPVRRCSSNRARNSPSCRGYSASGSGTGDTLLLGRMTPQYVSTAPS